jgi:polysaccharide export outer membrane protein
VRRLEGEHAYLVMRKARLEAQRDGQEEFIMPLLVGMTRRNVEFDLAFSAESNTFSRMSEIHRMQVQSLQNQRPRIEAELQAVSNQIAKQKEHLGIVNGHLVDLHHLFAKGLLRKDVLINQQIQKTLVEGQVSNLEAQVARLGQSMGDLDYRLNEVKAAYLRKTLEELQQTAARLREVETDLGPARRLLEVRARGTGADADESEYTVRISRIRDGSMVTVDATEETMLSPGDVVEVKLKRRMSDRWPGLPTQAIRELDPNSSIAQGTQPVSR